MYQLYLNSTRPMYQQLNSDAMTALAHHEKTKSHYMKLSKNFLFILDMLNDVEEMQFTYEYVKYLQETIRDLAYDLDDVLDDITSLCMIQESQRIQHHRASRVWKFIPTSTPGALKFNSRIMSKIKEITERSQSVVNRLTTCFNVLSWSSNRPSRMRFKSSPVVYEPGVYGRDEDKEAIKDMLLVNEASHDHVLVISIVGMGGIGKTTLAQLVYRDEIVNQNFHVKAWVWVSEEFDLLRITKTIFTFVTNMSAESMDLGKLRVSLQHKLSESKFLIVLDEFWNASVEKSGFLLQLLQFGLPGSRIIVTTRNDKLPSIVGPRHMTYHLKLLTNDDCGAILARVSNRSFHENLHFKEVGQGLMKKCKGLPLAARSLGGLLRNETTPEGWELVLNSKICNLPKDCYILRDLQLSYQHLPPHLKHLFAYCSIFPKDYEFDKNELVYLWMGEGFLEKPNEKKTKEELGIEYFNELLSRSFFQRSSGCDSTFVMHDLINDLAQYVAGGTSYHLDKEMDSDIEYQLPEKVRHASFLRHEFEVFRNFKAFLEARNLRTFLPMPVEDSRVCHLSDKILFELVSELPNLRVLSLSGYSITEVSSSMCNLIHLRYLNLSGTSIVTLPHFFSNLIRLETLSLCNCRFISSLPPSLGNLSSLRHLDNSNTQQLKNMPVEIGKLENIQTLPKIVLNKVGGLGMKELKNLTLLRGKLTILELQNVRNVEDVKLASLRHKKLDELQLTWGNDIDNSRNKSSDEQVIEYLQPNQNLTYLNIEFYGGENFPIWIGDPKFRTLSTVILRGCTECTCLPPLGLLPKLKELHIKNMPKIKHIGVEFYGRGPGVPFPKLEILRFSNMIGWEKWSSFSNVEADHIQFPHLRQFSMLKCHKLTNVSPLSFVVLRELDLEECNMVVLESFHNLKSLIYLRLKSIKQMCNLPRKLVHFLAALEVLECCSCNELQSLWPSEIPLDHLIRLKHLIIKDCSKLASLGERMPNNLETLELFRCANLSSLPNDLNNLGSLRDLIIKYCPKFVNFPENGVPPILKRLEIFSCKALDSLTGNILNLERLDIKECSSLKTWTMVDFPIDLKYLSINNCTKLEPLLETMFPQGSRMSLEQLNLCNWLNSENILQRLNRFSDLVELNISSCYSLTHFPEESLTPHLRSLSVEDCANLKSFSVKIQGMISLLSLEICSCPRLESFPECRLPPNLSSLKILDSKKLKNLSQWGLDKLMSLRELSISGGFEELKLLGDREGISIFPSSLIKLSIARFPKLSSLSKVLDDLTLLRHLSIANCAKLEDLPCDKVLTNLCHLKITQCEVLSRKCDKKRGAYWSKIYGIPRVEIHGSTCA
ncbi:hypothetical protein ACJIZ3_025370 [Penstemon smallii]|uniref:Uncharacterized protein n=1 Tax=Penstemon smallii TaxID=265156 RepID=A0ABD3TUE4_9LAMI